MSVQKIRFIALAYFVAAVVLRFVPHPPNFEAVGALALFAGCYLSPLQGVLIGLGAMAVSDLLGQALNIGSMGLYFRPTMFAVYTCVAVPALFGWALRKRVDLVTVPSAAVANSALFFFVTNFAVWLDPFMGFDATWQGLLRCYVDALPFVKYHLLGSLLFSGLFFGGYALLLKQFSLADRRTQSNSL